MPDAEILEAVAGAQSAHEQLLRSIAPLTDDQARSDSLLPGWTVGHVLTHVARNGDSHVRMLSAAIAGTSTTQYEGGREQRAADIEAGARRSAAALIDDVATSAAALEVVWAEMSTPAWAGHGLNAEGEVWPCAAMPVHRWREVELHHVDLGLGYTPAHWPDGYVERELAISLRLLPERLDPSGRRQLLAWLVGRTSQPGDVPLAAWQARPDHYLR